MLYSAPGMIVRLNLAAVAFHFLTEHMGNVLVMGCTTYFKTWSAIVSIPMIIWQADWGTCLGSRVNQSLG
ncbi:hypothetical protein L210DRAFT_2346609 [Boletus edulis BED1]|uniref:Uncharacterized protein n=1 Tax=Boletus edulis BED1 TaxID=1328754 RepID=A0AAD4BCF5_BOLED|nr:hypothetical protein L210DRAFT_2346609 [Boletus edulis BED1]